eukprot:gene35845-54551_t
MGGSGDVFVMRAIFAGPINAKSNRSSTKAQLLSGGANFKTERVSGPAVDSGGDAEFDPSRSNLRAIKERPGNWRCQQCGNDNFADRTHCNLKSCGAPNPDPSGKFLPTDKDGVF